MPIKIAFPPDVCDAQTICAPFLLTNMNVVEYDNYLSGLRRAEDWANVPQEDRVLHWVFGTVAPSIARRPHRLVIPSASSFREITKYLGAAGALLGCAPPSMEALPPDFGLSASFLAKLRAWQEPPNQEYLIEDLLLNLKFSSALGLICNSGLSEEVVAQIEKSVVFEGIVNGISDLRSWFEAVSVLVNDCGWFYLPLPEITQYDLLVFGENTPTSILEKMNSKLAPEQIGWSDNRAHWPVEEA
jgi:hypothetical protein